jgi:hypothetical protein
LEKGGEHEVPHLDAAVPRIDSQIARHADPPFRWPGPRWRKTADRYWRPKRWPSRDRPPSSRTAHTSCTSSSAAPRPASSPQTAPAHAASPPAAPPGKNALPSPPAAAAAALASQAREYRPTGPMS